MPSYQVKGKMIKHQVLLNSPEVHPHLPETNWFSTSRALQMLKKYPSIFIKPNGGTGGAGIIRVRKIGSSYEIALGKNRKSHSYPSLIKAFRTYEQSATPYLVQRGLDLATYKGKLFDLRIYMQKPAGEWTVPGMVARTAAPHRFITNHTRGGQAATLHEVLPPVYGNSPSALREITDTIRQLSRHIAEALEKKFPDIRELGIDLGIDKKGYIWFIEANTRPAHQLFTEIPDKSMLEQILRNKKLFLSESPDAPPA
ncbi:YheC/YheD family protein [Gorillibacterium timonense]|uniref:YheC/YheD family protein n=1 Tax=Gorillibacterium timonense TaxID=1689269 RepID=UPI00071DD548|nr:YheC/YheD family protein [Gorillibacterium timonense]